MRWLAMVAVLCAVPVGARAQEASVVAEARAAFERGIEQASAESWVEALESFRASLALLDRPATHLNVAAALLRLGRNVEARDEMDALLATATLSAEDRVRAVELRARAAEGVRTLELRVEPPSATVLVDGVVHEGAAALGRLELDPGRHRLEVRADGHAPEVRDLEPGAAATIVRLSPLPALLRVRSSVEGAAISVDGEERGRTSADVEVAPGRHQLVVAAPDHRPFERWLSLASGQELDVSATLERGGGDLLEDPWFWGVGGVALAVVAGLSIGLGVGLSAPGYDGGSLGDVLRPR